MVEVKNTRGWIYPNSAELYQVLDKGAQLQIAHPEVPFIPLLICRRMQHTTQAMAADLGFFVVGSKAQFIDWPDNDDPKADCTKYAMNWDTSISRLTLDHTMR